MREIQIQPQVQTEIVEKPRNAKRVIVLFLMISLFIIAGLYLTYSYLNNNTPSGVTEEFVICLAGHNATMYGTSWCHYCQQQKQMLSPYFEKIRYIDCDSDKEACAIAKVTGYPTWVINNVKHEGLQSLEQLSTITGCKL